MSIPGFAPPQTRGFSSLHPVRGWTSGIHTGQTLQMSVGSTCVLFFSRVVAGKSRVQHGFVTDLTKSGVSPEPMLSGLKPRVSIGMLGLSRANHVSITGLVFQKNLTLFLLRAGVLQRAHPSSKSINNTSNLKKKNCSEILVKRILSYLPLPNFYVQCEKLMIRIIRLTRLCSISITAW